MEDMDADALAVQALGCEVGIHVPPLTERMCMQSVGNGEGCVRRN